MYRSYFTPLFVFVVIMSSQTCAQSFCPDGLIDGDGNSFNPIVEEYSSHTYYLSRGGDFWPMATLDLEDFCGNCGWGSSPSEDGAEALIDFGSAQCTGGIVTATEDAGDDLMMSITVTWGAAGNGSIDYTLINSTVWFDNGPSDFGVGPGCEINDFSVEVLIVPATVSIEEEQPNVVDYLQVADNEITLRNPQNIRNMTIITLSGCHVMALKPAEQNSIDLSMLASGIYVVQMMLNDGTPLRTKISVSH